MTRDALLATMTKRGACGPALEYVSSFDPACPAIHIWLSCDNADWLAWMVARTAPTHAIRFTTDALSRGVTAHLPRLLVQHQRRSEAKRYAKMKIDKEEELTRLPLLLAQSGLVGVKAVEISTRYLFGATKILQRKDKPNFYDVVQDAAWCVRQAAKAMGEESYMQEVGTQIFELHELFDHVKEALCEQSTT